MSFAFSLGYPRIGKQRELKFAQEKYWAGKFQAKNLLAIAADQKFSMSDLKPVSEFIEAKDVLYLLLSKAADFYW